MQKKKTLNGQPSGSVGCAREKSVQPALACRIVR